MKISIRLLILGAALLAASVTSVKIEELENDPIFEVKKSLHAKGGAKAETGQKKRSEQSPVERKLANDSKQNLEKLQKIIALVRSFEDDPNFDVGVTFNFAPSGSNNGKAPSGRKLVQTKSNMERFMDTFMAINKPKLTRTPNGKRKVRLVSKSARFAAPKGLY